MKETIQPLIGVSAAMQQVRAELAHAARCESKVLVTGESGVGKEIVGRLIHQQSRRGHLPLVAINCVGIPESLLESELFGHVRGSFTGAHRDRLGLLEMAHGGTVFLDEVGEMGSRMQALLLRFLETGELQRVGADGVTPRVNVRVIAATNRDPLVDVAARTFREDLYYRLNVIDITIPPLRARREDIPVLFAHYLARYGEKYAMAPPTLAPEARQLLVDYDWPGNVRQLKNVAERLIVRGGAHVGVAELRLRDAGAAAGGAAAPARSAADLLFERMVKQGESFWAVVYPPFMARDLTRSELRALIARGLQATFGNYKMLVAMFNMDPSDYKRFLNFLRKQQCQVPYAAFRVVKGGATRMSEAPLPPSCAAPVSHLRY